jgi:L-ascorbate metabolism protein UlaG (beta-lactamase superfamily)
VSNLKLTFLAHSGFTVETDTKVLVFDYYQDAQGIVDAYARGPKPLWFFVSHWHGDHFNRHIADYSDHTAQYIVNRDVSLKGVPKDKLQVMDIYERLDVGDVSVTQFGSTDEGGSFLVRTDDCTVFHAGDLNWWQWLGDTVANNADARRWYDEEMKRLDGLSVDVAFFPVDARLETAREWGVLGFLDCVKVRHLLVPMHYFGPAWEPSLKFQAQHDDVPLWIPHQGGDTIDLNL